MAEGNIIGQLAGNLFGNVFTGIIVGLIIVAIFGVVGYVIWYFAWYKKQFDIIIKVTSDRAEDPSVFFDWAAIFNDRKDKSKYVRLLKSRIELPVPPFLVFSKTNMGDYAELHRTSEDSFYWLTSPKIDKTQMISLSGKNFPVARMKQIQLEQDVHRILRMKEQNKSIIDPEGLWTKILQLLPVLIPGFIMLLLFWVFMDKMPSMMQSLSELVQELKDLKSVQVAAG